MGFCGFAGLEASFLILEIRFCKDIYLNPRADTVIYGVPSLSTDSLLQTDFWIATNCSSAFFTTNEIAVNAFSTCWWNLSQIKFWNTVINFLSLTSELFRVPVGARQLFHSCSNVIRFCSNWTVFKALKEAASTFQSTVPFMQTQGSRVRAF